MSLQRLLEGFIQDDAPIDTQYPPQMHSTDVDEGGWIDLVASLEERYASTHRVGEGDRNERPLESHSTIASSIDKITRLPTNDDYPLWRVRCKVFLTSVIFRHAHTFV
jgi:ribosomal protein L24